MARVCEITGKRPMFGNNVSKSNNHTKRKFLPNLHLKKFYIPELDKFVWLKVSANAIRTITKKGLYQVIKDIEKKYHCN